MTTTWVALALLVGGVLTTAIFGVYTYALERYLYEPQGGLENPVWVALVEDLSNTGNSALERQRLQTCVTTLAIRGPLAADWLCEPHSSCWPYRRQPCSPP